MRQIWNDVENWQGAGKKVALATVVTAQGSSLRPQGSKMAISATGEISGSVTGGCVEGAVFEEAQGVLKSGVPRLLGYGVTNAEAWEVGLSCGGSIKVFVESMATGPWQEIYPAIQECLEKRLLAAVATVVTGPEAGKKWMILPDGRCYGDAGTPELNRAIEACIPENWTPRDPTFVDLQTEQGEAGVFIDFILPPPRLVIVGAAHIAIPLVALANTMNYRTIVVDARSAFATRERFPHADELIVDWPADILQRLELDPAAAVVCLSHDPKIDNPAGYIGAVGSRKGHATRLDVLREDGADETQLGRIHAPIGLNMGARQPEEIALAIMAEIVAAQHGYALRRDLENS